MREGLRSAAKLCRKILTGATPSEKAVVEKDEQCNGEKDCDSGTKEEGNKLAVKVGPKDGSKRKESGGKISTAEVNAVEVISSARKRRRIGGEAESNPLAQKAECDIGKRVENEEVVDDKNQAVGRVLRSRSAMKSRCENEGNEGQSKVVVSKKQLKVCEGLNNGSVEAKKEMHSQSKGEFGDPLITEIEEKPKAKDDATPSGKAVVENDQQCNGDEDCDSGTKEEAFVSTLKQDVGASLKDGPKDEDLNFYSGTKEDGSKLIQRVGPKDGSECKQSGGKISTAEVNPVQDISGATERRRIDGEAESKALAEKADCDIGKKVGNEEVVDDKPQAVGRVLQSRSTMKTKCENENNEGQGKVVVSGKQPKGCGGSENEGVEAKKEVQRQSKGEFGDPLTFEIEEKPKAKDDATPSGKAVVENDQHCNVEKDCDFGTKEEAFFSTLKQDVGTGLKDGPKDEDLNRNSETKEDGSELVLKVGPKDGSICKESGEKISTAEVNAVISSARKRRRIEGEVESKALTEKAACDIGKKVENEEVVDDKPQAVGRVLRSRSAVKTKCENEGNVEQSNVVSEKQPKACEGSEKESVEAKKEVHSQSTGEFGGPLATEIEEKPKAKRGRPPKSLEGNGSEKKRVEAKNEYAPKESSLRAKFKRKRGRPCKVQKSDGPDLEKEKSCQFGGEESGKSYGRPRKKLKKRGRPRKENEGKKVGIKGGIEKGTKSTHNEGNSQFSGKRSAQDESKIGHLMFAEKTKCGDNENGGSRIGQTAAGTRGQEKQVVRDQIVELLKGAGWTIQHRPRNGRKYCDAVYVNPEGRTHWSVTLAYRVFKKDSDERGFQFTPIPDEELNILTRVVGKERSDKNKKKKKKKLKQESYGEAAEGFAKIKRHKRKLHKRKLHKRKPDNAGSRSHKMLNKRIKVKASREERDDSVRNRKRVKVHDKKGFALMARNSNDNAESKSDGYVLYSGKRTVLAWMINLGTVLPNVKVQYFKRRKARVLNGRITTDGIQCECCNETISISEFESHAGTKTCQPLKNIHLETGTSLWQCQLESWHKQDERVLRGFHVVNVDGDDPNDDTCGICGDGGNLICCDSCPSTFHQSCLGIENFPSGLWHCMYCLCKLCGKVDGNVCQEDDDAAAMPTLLSCCLCEEKYHRSCVQVEGNIDDDSGILLFCGRSCQELYGKLQMLLGVKHELEEGFSWSFIRRFDVSPDISLNGMARKVECNCKAAVALDVMDECFLPMVDNRSGVNLIHNVVYNFGSNFNRLNYSNFLTAILERGDEIIVVASIRIHGNSLAEMPFIGTRHMYRRQGMCRRLLTGIETALRFLHVEKLIIPAISELRETWTSVFGFMPLEGSSKQRMRNMNLMVFPGVDMLQKPMLGHNEENMMSESFTSKLEEYRTLDDLPKDSEERCSSEFDLKTSNEIGSSPAKKTGSDLTKLDLVPVLSDCCLNDTSDITTENVSQAVKVNNEVVAIESASHVPHGCLRNTNDTCCKETDALTCGSGAVESASLPSHCCLNDSSAVTSKDSKHEYSLDQSGTGIALEDSNMRVHEKEQDAVNGHFDVMAADHKIDPSLGSDGVTACDITVKCFPQDCKSNGHISAETTSISCGTDLNVDNCPITDRPGRNTRSSKRLNSDNNEVDIDDVRHGDSDTLCNSGSGGGVGMHCASGGGNPCAATEVVILSNQAS